MRENFDDSESAGYEKRLEDVTKVEARNVLYTGIVKRRRNTVEEEMEENNRPIDGACMLSLFRSTQVLYCINIYTISRAFGK